MRWWDNICANCGAGYPVRVPTFHAVSIIAVLVEMILLASRHVG